MGRKLIVQIGRFETKYTEPKKFIYNEKVFEVSLSSFALSEFYKEDNVKVFLLYPVSLLLNEAIVKGPYVDRFIGKVKELLGDSDRKEGYFKSPENLFKDHPHSEKAEFAVMHSLGFYQEFDLKTNMPDLVLYIWSLLIYEYIKNGFDELFVDIGSGLNFYISALLEAFRYFMEWESLYNLRDRKVKGFIVYSDPIIGTNRKQVNIYEYPVDFKGKFESPARHSEIERGLLKRVIKSVIETSLSKEREYKREIEKYINAFFIMFSAFYNAAPLILFVNEFPDVSEINLALEGILEKIFAKYKSNWKQSPNFQFEDFYKIIVMLGFLKGLKEFLDSGNIKPRGYATVEEIDRFAESIGSIGLHVQEGLIKTESYNNFKPRDIVASIDEDWKPLRNLLKRYQGSEEDESEGRIDRDRMERNFFAHGGFARDLVEVKKDTTNGGRILIRYNQEAIEKVKELLCKRIKGAGQ
ncbi:MAG TPA: TM1812 family CRISPR-associated protein [Spirochaetota bacterium]|nr:TM1812 family CRISPR-associated protein [Spirochaetota bacterium]